jgi:hypothetical protein
MELLMVLIIVIVFCLILDISLDVIVLGLIALIGIVSGLFALAFLGCMICLLGCKRKPATFLRTDNVKGSKFQVAYYMVEGRECPCVFPKEVVLESKLYRTDKIYHVMVSERVGKVFDRFAVVTCVLGLVAGIVLSVGVLYYFLR